MRKIDSFAVRHRGRQGTVSLYVGDLSKVPPEEGVDVVVVSAFADDYRPARGTVIHALGSVGVNVGDLARHKAQDLRAFASCWLSGDVGRDGVGFRRLLCFEPAYRGRAPEVVGDVFRSLVLLATGSPPIRQVAMPVLASGNQGEPPEVMLDTMLDAAVHWLRNGLPVEQIKVVVLPSDPLAPLADAFARARRRAGGWAPPGAAPAAFEAFLSYCQKDAAVADAFVARLLARRPAMRLFVDRLELDPGQVWQAKIADALSAARRVICLYSPNYVSSKACMEEWAISKTRQDGGGAEVLLPVYVYSANLPPPLWQVQYVDAREAEPAKLDAAADRLLSHL